jgi:hypothetical protein
MLLTRVREELGSNLGQHIRFSQSLQADTETVPWLVQSCFIPNRLQLIIYQSSHRLQFIIYRSSHHSVLDSPATQNVIKHPTVIHFWSYEWMDGSIKSPNCDEGCDTERWSVWRSSVVGWVTMLQGGRSRVRFSMRSLDISMHLILPAALLPWGRLSLLTEMSTRNLPGGKGRPVRKADNLTAICELIV